MADKNEISKWRVLFSELSAAKVNALKAGFFTGNLDILVVGLGLWGFWNTGGLPIVAGGREDIEREEPLIWKTSIFDGLRNQN